MAIGKVTNIKVGHSDFGGEIGTITVNGSIYFLWWEEAWPEDFDAGSRLRQSMWISMLKEAMTNNYDVEVLTESNSSSKVLTINIRK